MGDRMDTTEIIAALRDRYPTGKGEWSFFTEVPNGTGSNKDRSCDALAMNLWPSKGLVLHGHEVKASRSDWQKEMQDPSKAEAFARYCDYWWIVAPKGVLKLEELPTDWGWICPLESGSTKVRKPANKRTPELWTREFLAGLMRSISKADSLEKAVREAQNKHYQLGYKAGLDVGQKAIERDWEKDRLKRRVEELEELVGEFEKWQRSCRATTRDVTHVRQSAQRLINGLQALVEQSQSVDFGLVPQESSH